MNNKMNALATALTDAGLPARTSGDVIFCEGWGIHCSVVGKIQARYVRDTHVRFGIGAINEPVEIIVESFQAALENAWS